MIMQENPEPIAREMFPTFPAKSEQGKRPPTAPAPKPVNLPEVNSSDYGIIISIIVYRCPLNILDC